MTVEKIKDKNLHMLVKSAQTGFTHYFVRYYSFNLMFCVLYSTI